MTNWTTWVRMPSGQIVQVWITAPTPSEAKLMLESQYGAGNLVHPPSPV